MTKPRNFAEAQRSSGFFAISPPQQSAKIGFSGERPWPLRGSVDQISTISPPSPPPPLLLHLLLRTGCCTINAVLNASDSFSRWKIQVCKRRRRRRRRRRAPYANFFRSRKAPSSNMLLDRAEVAGRMANEEAKAKIPANFARRRRRVAVTRSCAAR